MESRIDLQQQIVHLVGPDPSEPAEFVATIRCVLADPRFQPGFGFMRDRRGVAPPSAQFVEDVAHLMREIGDAPRSRYAIVVDTLASYGMMRLARKRTWGAWVEIELFETPAEALLWIREARRAAGARPPHRTDSPTNGDAAF